MILTGPIIVLYYSNIIMLHYMKMIMVSRYRGSILILSMIDPLTRSSHQTSIDLPMINTVTPSNYRALSNLWQVFSRLFAIQYERGMKYMLGITLVYSLQFFYICGIVILMKKPVLSIGGSLYLSYAIFDFATVTFELFMILKFGSDANAADEDFLKVLRKKAQEAQTIKALCRAE